MIFGDLERALAQFYPYRVPIAIGLAIGAAALVIVARRRGWLGHLRRHPRGTLVGIGLLIVVGLPTAWVLGSPLFIRTQVDEAAPVVAVLASPAPGVSAAGLSGSFTGADDFHFGSGRATVLQTSPGRFTLRLEDFSVRNGPDLFVYLSPSPDGYADGAVELGALKATDGSFNYEIPAGTDLSTIGSVVVWCRAFSVLFATAPLAAG